MWNTLNFRGRGKLKKKDSKYLQQDPRYRIWSRSVYWFRRYVRWQSREKLKHIFLVPSISWGKADSIILLRFECTINPKKSHENRWSHFWENENFKFFFLCGLPLILRVDRKRKNKLEIFFKGTLDIECERDWSVSLGARLCNGQKIKNYFSSFRDFFGKRRKCHIVGLRMYYKPKKFDQNRFSHFWENQNFKFFSCELPLILGMWEN